MLTLHFRLKPRGRPSISQSAVSPVPLCVDLDGTLVKTDTLFESVLKLKQKPLLLLSISSWLSHGRARLKHELAQHVLPDTTALPYRDDLIDWLKKEKAQGRLLVLVTAANIRIAEAVNAHLQLFDTVMGSTETVNLKSAAKGAELVKQFGEKGFDYMGDSPADVNVWRHCRKGYVVSSSRRLLKLASKDCEIGGTFETGGTLRDIARALRPTQWMKNLLVVLPLLLSHQVRDPALWLLAGLAFAAFSLCASAAYVMNDLLDLEADRYHFRKRHRPFASGRVSIPTGAIMFILLVVGAMGLALLTGKPMFLAMLSLYFIATMAYSIELKRRLLVDVLMLAGLYTHRILSGGVAMSVEITPWLLAFAMFFFLSLAFVKRFSELRLIPAGETASPKGRGYTLEDMPLITSVGTASGYMSVLVLALYINGDTVRLLYPHPELLWGICPLLLYWITRIWFVASRKGMHDDPIVYALTDRISLIIGGLIGIVGLLASIRSF